MLKAIEHKVRWLFIIPNTLDCGLIDEASPQ